MKTIDQYLRLLALGKFNKASRLQPLVDVNKHLWNKYLKEWKKAYEMP